MSGHDYLWSLISIFFMVIYFIIIFRVIFDVFRRHDIGGGAKALWILALLIIPLVTLLIYIISQGKGMAERDQKQVAEVQQQQAAYIRDVAGSGAAATPADQIKQAQDLLSSGAITQDEFNALKAKALS